MRLTAIQLLKTYSWNDLLFRMGNVTALHARILFVPILVALVIAARGCAAPPRAIADETQFMLISSQPADDALLAADLLAPRTGMWRYLVVAGDNPGNVVQFKRTATKEHGASWANHEGDDRTEFWATDGRGNLQLTAVYEAQDQAVSLFEPPFTVPAELRPGEPHQEKSSMRVVDARTLSTQKASGTATRTIEYVGNERIRTPLGTHDAQRIVLHFLAEMGVATAETTSTYYIVPGLGLVAEETTERVRILGMFGRSMDRTIVLVADD